MLKREIVRRDVGLVLRRVVIASTPFTRDNYSELIVPNKPLLAGWEADAVNWAMILKEVEVEIRHLDLAYQLLNVTQADADATLPKPLFEAAELLTDKIVKAQAPAPTVKRKRKPR